MANHDRLCLANDDDDEFYVNTILKYKPKAGVEKKKPGSFRNIVSQKNAKNNQKNH